MRPPISQALTMLAAEDLLPAGQRRLASEMADKCATSVIYVAVVGEFKRGKSTLVNALLSSPLLPTGILPVTAVPTLVAFGSQPRAIIHREDETSAEVPTDSLQEYLSENGNPGNRKRIREVVIEYPAPVLATGIVLADTPGTGSVHSHNSLAASAFLPRVDVAILVLTADAPLSAAEADLLHSVSATAADVAVVLNKADRLAPDELEEALTFVRERMAPVSGSREPRLFPVSAKEGMAHGNGGVSALTAWLMGDVARVRTQLVDLRSRTLARHRLSVAEAALELEAAAAAAPRIQRERAQKALLEAQSELAEEAEETGTLLLAACTKTTNAILTERAQWLRDNLPSSLLAGSDEEWTGKLQAAAAAWSHDTEAAINNALARPLDRHMRRLRELVGRFSGKAGMAFGISLPEVPLPVAQAEALSIRIDIHDEPGALAMGIRQLRKRVPGSLGKRWRERARSELAMEAADRLAGQLRFAAAESTLRAARTWIADADSGWQDVSECLAAAVKRAESESVATSQPGMDFEALQDRLDTIRQLLDTNQGA